MEVAEAVGEAGHNPAGRGHDYLAGNRACIVQHRVAEATDGKRVEALVRRLPRRPGDALRNNGLSLDADEAPVRFRYAGAVYFRAQLPEGTRLVGEDGIVELGADRVQAHQLEVTLILMLSSRCPVQW